MENYLQNAMAAIDGYFMKEFGELNPTRYDDLERVDLAYTMFGENEEHAIQAYADLVGCEFTQYVDGKLINVEHYDSLEDMTELLLRWMSFDDLVYIDVDTQRLIIEEDIRDVMGARSNERIWELGYTGPEPNPHTENIEVLTERMLDLVELWASL